MFDEARQQILLERRKTVTPGVTEIALGDHFTHSFNLATGDRSYMDTVWRVLHVTPQNVYAEAVLNVKRREKPGDFLSTTGSRHYFDRGEYQFYDASALVDLILAERRAEDERIAFPATPPSLVKDDGEAA